MAVGGEDRQRRCAILAAAGKACAVRIYLRQPAQGERDVPCSFACGRKLQRDVARQRLRTQPSGVRYPGCRALGLSNVLGRHQQCAEVSRARPGGCQERCARPQPLRCLVGIHCCPAEEATLAHSARRSGN
ncbi:hypothetical protein SS50377_25093 [Spironucleus salmonicida]|uniref:Uncharacterized protein n=1 Tax=Spironucleus salmonicida TaxID=348837 RepID=A0A9P8LRM3_9EUKA|nr:hypothetical protein SS50377_25093 [Spironucleus salmonicida]